MTVTDYTPLTPQSFEVREKMSRKKLVFLTIVSTFLVTALIFWFVFGGFFMSLAGLISNKNDFTSEMLAYIDNTYIGDINKDALKTDVRRTLMRSLGDRYGEYYTKEEFEAQLTQLGGEYNGIGVSVVPGDTVSIISVFKDSPADRAGIMPGDIIVSVDGILMNDETYNEILLLLKNGESKSCHIVLSRNGENYETDVVPEKINMPTVFCEIGDDKIAYIKIEQFLENTGDDFEKEINALKDKGAKGIIIDLRNNPGGILESVVTAADAVLEDGTILYSEDKNQKKSYYSAREGGTDLPIAILINQNSASGAEAFTGALKDNERATVIGTKSFGKGVMQSFFRLSDGSAFKITYAKYYTPSGVCIDQSGIEPDIFIEGDDAQLKKAYEILK